MQITPLCYAATYASLPAPVPFREQTEILISSVDAKFRVDFSHFRLASLIWWFQSFSAVQNTNETMLQVWREVFLTAGRVKRSLSRCVTRALFSNGGGKEKQSGAAAFQTALSSVHNYLWIYRNFFATFKLNFTLLVGTYATLYL